MWQIDSLHAQIFHSIKYYSVDKDSSVFTFIKLENKFSNLELSQAYIEKLPLKLQAEGYMAASLDSVVTIDSQSLVHIYFGDKLSWAAINIEQEVQSILRQANIAPAYNKDEINLVEFKRVQDNLLEYFENNGYPFAQVGLDSVRITDSKIYGNLFIEKGTPYKVDSIRLMGSARISQNFIHRYLDLPKGGIYRKQALGKINQRLLELPYVQQIQPWDLTMLNTGSLVNLYLQPKRSNQVNVLAGFLPSNQQTGGKLLLTVDANLQLQNAFSTGERIGIIWQQIQPKSPRLNLQYMQPYIFKSSFGIDFLFELFKKDSSFLNLNGQLGLLYMIATNKTAKIIIQTQSTSVLEVDTLQVKFTRQLPTVADVSSINVGIDYEINSTNYRFNPRKGSEFSIFGGVGQKTIKRNNTISQIKDPTFNYNSLYDTLKLKAYQLRFRGRFAQYIPVGKQSVVKTGVQAGWYQSPNAFRNELFQVGGYKMLRGFDEESVFASAFAVGTIEYRYLLGLNSNFFTFTDFGFTSNTITSQRNTYLGAGVGLSFETKGGIFNLSYAAGKRNDLNFDIRQSKIHFGYVSIF